jgi:hypothetical protein
MRSMSSIMNTRRMTLATGLTLTFMLLAFCLWKTPQSPDLANHTGSGTVSTPDFRPGQPKSPGSSYTRTLVIGKLPEEDTSWIDRELPGINTSIYTVGVDTPNKGHEAMVYLTYIIDHYDNLADTNIFFHPHLITWHNNDLLDSNAATTIRHLSDEHVARVGYFNSRCHEEPGCPDWLHLDRPESELDPGRKMEERYFTPAIWKELHPEAPIPYAISQPCCAQFMVSRERIRSHPRSEYLRYREWLITTSLTDEMSGRVMEYTWQYLFTGETEVCPQMNRCYCDGYGVCFGGEAEVQNWFDIRDKERVIGGDISVLYNEGKTEEVKKLEVERESLRQRMDLLKEEAFERGADPRNRAIECGRDWKEGDGF